MDEIAFGYAEKLNAAVDAPYPPVKVEKENPLYATAILDNMGGKVSESTLLSAYLYHHLTLKKYEDVALICRKIETVENHHLHIMGELTVALGGEPRLWSISGEKMMTYWSAGYHKYPTLLEEALLLLIQEEKKTIDKYSRQANGIKDNGVVANLLRVIEDERLHLEMLEGLFKLYYPNGEADMVARREYTLGNFSLE